MFIDDPLVGSRISWDGAIDRLAGAASKILPSSNLLHKAVNFKIVKLIKLIAKKIISYVCGLIDTFEKISDQDV